MAAIPQEAQDVFNAVKCVSFVTSTPDGTPNANIIGMKKIIDDETIYLSDQFFKKTLANLQQNQKVAILFWNEDGAYQIKGTARYINEGAEFEEQAAWVNAIFEKMGRPVKAKGGVFVTVESVFSAKSGPDAGDQIA